MKRDGNLFEKIILLDNMQLAFWKARPGSQRLTARANGRDLYFMF